MSQQRVHVPDASLPSPGSARAFVPPLRRYYQGTATSCRPSRRASFPSFGGATGSRTFRSQTLLRAATSGLGLVTRYPRPGLLPWRRQDLPSSWGTPIPVCPCSSTPAGRCVPDHGGTLAWPPLRERRRRRRQRLSRLDGMAFGLAAYVSRDGYPPDRARLASGCWSSSPGRAFTRKAPMKGFQLTSCLLSSSPKLLGTIPRIPPESQPQPSPPVVVTWE